MKILFRILGFPFFVCLAFIACIRLWILYVKNYIIYGGEAVAYTHKMNPITLKMLFDKLNEHEK